MGPDALTLQRAAKALQARGHRRLANALLWTSARLYGAHLHLEAELSPGVELGYGGLGIVISAGVRIGAGSFICQNVTLGPLAGKAGAPQLGQNVLIGAGAKVLGPVKIGDGAAVGANAVVLSDVAEGAVVVGVPARPLVNSRAARAREDFARHRTRPPVGPPAPS